MGNDSFFLSAGDLSGDNAASRLVAELRRIYPSMELFGLGGAKLGRLGQQQLANPEDLAVLGFWEVAKRFRFFGKLLKYSAEMIRSKQPRAVILVDYPGFNLRLAERIRSLGIPIIYYISPQVWAWGKRRIEQLRKLVDLMLVILPFEETYYKDHDVNSRFVGHYLLEDIPDEYIASTPPDSNTMAILPGSRPQEIERMLRPMLQAARQLNGSCGMQSVVVGISGKFDYETCIAPYRSSNVELSFEDSRSIINRTRYVLTKSGTATLETGIIGRPMVIVYKTGFVTYQIARRLVKLDSIGLVNLVLGAHTVPELIQRGATSETMAREVLQLVNNPEEYSRIRGELNRVPSILGGPGASSRAAGLISEFLDGKS